MPACVLQSQGLILKIFHLFLVLTGANKCYISLESICSCSFQSWQFANVSYCTWTCDLSERVSLSYWNLTLKLSFIVLLVTFLSVTDYCIFCWLWYSLIDQWRIKSRCWVHSLFEVGIGALWCTDCHSFQWYFLPWSFALAELICFSTFRTHGRC